MTIHRDFLRAYQGRYQLARSFCQVPRRRAAWNALRGALEELACAAVTGHDFAHIDGQLRCDTCATTKDMT